MSQIWMSHVTHMKRVDATHAHIWNDSSIRVMRLIHMCDMSHSYVWHDSFHRRQDGYTWHNSFMCVTLLFHTRDTTHPSVWHDSFIRVTYPFPPQTGWLNHPIYYGVLMCETWLIHTCDMPLSTADGMAQLAHILRSIVRTMFNHFLPRTAPLRANSPRLFALAFMIATQRQDIINLFCKTRFKQVSFVKEALFLSFPSNLLHCMFDFLYFFVNLFVNKFGCVTVL